MLSNKLGVSSADYLLFGTKSTSHTQTPRTVGDIARIIAGIPDLSTVKIEINDSSLDIGSQDVPPPLLSFCSKFLEYKSKELDEGTKELFNGWLKNQFSELDDIPLHSESETVIQIPKATSNTGAEFVACEIPRPKGPRPVRKEHMDSGSPTKDDSK